MKNCLLTLKKNSVKILEISKKPLRVGDPLTNRESRVDDKQILTDLQNVSASSKAQEILRENNITWMELLQRHANGDYGEVDKEQALRNDIALFKRSGVAHSVYELENGEKVSVITSFSQTVTDILSEGEHRKNERNEPVTDTPM